MKYENTEVLFQRNLKNIMDIENLLPNPQSLIVNIIFILQTSLINVINEKLFTKSSDLKVPPKNPH